MCNGTARPPCHQVKDTGCSAAVCVQALQAPACRLEWWQGRRGWKVVAGVVLGVTAVCYLLLALVSTPALVYLWDSLGLPTNITGSLCERCQQFRSTFLIGEENRCTVRDNVYLLVMVTSHHANVDARQGIRRTWGSLKHYKGLHIKTVFTFGVHEDKNLNNQLKFEQGKYGDIVQADFADTYRTLTEKTVMSLQWAARYCPNAQFVMKTDDDSFNYIQRFMRFLSEENSNPHGEPFVGGRCFTVKPDRRVTSKYFIPPERYPDQYYPVYCAGPAYVLSMNAVSKILAVVDNVRYLPLEDVYITGFVRVAADLHYTQIPGLLVAKENIGDCDLATWVTNTHQVSPAEMQALWERARTVGETSGCRARDLYLMLLLNIVFITTIGGCLVCMWKHRLRRRTLSLSDR